MIPHDALEALASLAEIAFVGRVLLSLLPPGLPGRHGFRDLPATWAASHLLGTVVQGIESQLGDLSGIHPAHPALLAPWLLLALARWITLPGAMVPRHEPLAESPGPSSRALAVIAPLAVAAAAFHGDTPVDSKLPFLLADALALLALCRFGLSAARRAPLGRSLAVLALALVLAAALIYSRARTIPLALCMGSGAAFAGVWLRRGDRRAAALSVIAFAGSALLGPREALFGAAGLFALWLHTAEPSRKSIALFAAAVFAPCAALGWNRLDAVSSAEPALSPITAAVAVVVAMALAMRKRLADARDRDRAPATATAGSIDPTRTESAAVRDAVLLCLFPLASRGELSSLSALSSALLPLAPMIALECGLVFAPAERPLAADPRPAVGTEPTTGAVRR